RITLALQRELRASNLERKDVVKRLKVDQSADATAQNLPAMSNPVPGKMKLGELFICAEILTDNELEEAIDDSKSTEKMLGEILLEKRWISQDILTAALRLQALLWDNVISLRKATDVLREAHTLAGSPGGVKDIDGLMVDTDVKNVSLYEF